MRGSSPRRLRPRRRSSRVELTHEDGNGAVDVDFKYITDITHFFPDDPDAPMPDEAPVTSAVLLTEGSGRPTG